MNSYGRWIPGILATILLLASAPAPAAEGTGAPEISIGEKGLRVRTADGRFRFKIGGRLHADASIHVGDTPGPDPGDGARRDTTDGTEIRRARFLLKATLFEDWAWTGEVDFASNSVALKDFDIAYRGLENSAISLGHQKQPYSLDVEMSSNDSPFIERGIDNDLIIPVVDRAIGIRLDTHGDRWFVAAGFYGDGATSGASNASEGWGTAARAIVTPIRQDDRILHLGFRGAVRLPGTDDDTLRFRAETTHMSDYFAVDTSDIENIDEVILYGPEAAFAWGPFSIYGEYNRAAIRRRDADTLQFESGHIAVTWTLTGESRAAAYRIGSGEFKRLRPKRDFSLKSGGIGAWEVGARYAYVNLTDGSASSSGSVNGGKEHALTAALNWYVNPVIRFMVDWTHILETGAEADPPEGDINREARGLDIFAFRTQFAF